MTLFHKALRAAGVGVMLGLLTACATATLSSGMTLTPGAMPPLAHGARGEHAFRLGDVTGGNETRTMGLSNITNDELRTALDGSLRNMNYLAADPSKAGYVVTVNLVELNRPSVALDPVLIFVPIDLSVTARIRYTVTPVGSSQPVFDDIVATTGTASAGDSGTPAGRVRKANEAAVRLNMIAFLERLQTEWK